MSRAAEHLDIGAHGRAASGSVWPPVYKRVHISGSQDGLLIQPVRYQCGAVPRWQSIWGSLALCQRIHK